MRFWYLHLLLVCKFFEKPNQGQSILSILSVGPIRSKIIVKVNNIESYLTYYTYKHVEYYKIISHSHHCIRHFECWLIWAWQIIEAMPIHNFLLQIQCVEGNFNSTEKLVLLQWIVSPNGDLECLQTNDLKWHTIFKSFLQYGFN